MLAAPVHSRKKTRVAFHEAGHAVLSAAINDAPQLVSIKARANTLGRSCYRFEAGPAAMAQVHLAGFAAEEILTGRRPRQFDGPELRFPIAAAVNPSLKHLGDPLKGSDQYLAVHEVLKMGHVWTSDLILREIERFYQIAREDLSAIWGAVESVANVLLKFSEIDRAGFFRAIEKHGIYGPVFEVQKMHGLRSRAV